MNINDDEILKIFDFDGDDQQEIQQEHSGFIVDNLSKADWTVKKIVGYQNLIEDRKLAASEMKAEPLEQIKRIDDWLSKEITEAQKNIDYLSSLLQPFVAEQVEGKKKRSITLPSGRAGFKKGSVTFFYGDNQACKDNEQLLEFLVDNHYTDYVKTEITETVDWASLKKSLKITDDGSIVIADTGEIIDLMRTEQAPDAFKILPPKDI